MSDDKIETEIAEDKISNTPTTLSSQSKMESTIASTVAALFTNPSFLSIAEKIVKMNPTILDVAPCESHTQARYLVTVENAMACLQNQKLSRKCRCRPYRLKRSFTRAL